MPQACLDRDNSTDTNDTIIIVSNINPNEYHSELTVDNKIKKIILYSVYITRNSSYSPFFLSCILLSISLFISIHIILHSIPKLLVRKCDWSLQFSVEQSMGYDSHPKAIAIAVVNYGTHTLGIFIGLGNGTFQNQQIYSTGNDSHPSALATGDVNNDQKVDIIVANYATNSIAIFLGYGNGTFAKQMSYSMGYDSFPYSVTVADLNNDNRLDILIGNKGIDSICILYGDQNGTFIRQKTYFTGVGSRPQSIAVGDINNDGQLDIILVNSGKNQIAIFLGRGNESFSSLRTYSTGQCCYPTSLLVADFNQDNQLDIAIVYRDTSTIGILHGKADGSFTKIRTTFSTSPDAHPYAIGIGDFNNDTQLDIVVPNYSANNIGILFGKGVPPFASQITYSTGSQSSSYWVTVADINKDNRLDIIIPNRSKREINILFGYGNGTFASVTSYSTGSNFDPYAVVIGDFNNDSYPDIAAVSCQNTRVGIMLGNGNDTFENLTAYIAGPNSCPNSVAFGDFDGDRIVDMVVALENTAVVNVYRGNGNGSFSYMTNFDTGPNSGPHSVHVADLNNDTQLDIVVANSNSNNVGLLYGYGNGSFQKQIAYLIGYNSLPYSIVSGDFNKDMRNDLVVANYNKQGVDIFLQKCRF